MPCILPVSDLRNYNEVLQNVSEESPVFLTKNGRGCYVVIAPEGSYRGRTICRTGWLAFRCGCAKEIRGVDARHHFFAKGLRGFGFNQSVYRI